MRIVQVEVVSIHGKIHGDYRLGRNTWWEWLSVSTRNRNSLWFSIFLVKLFDGEMIEAGRKLGQDIAVDICDKILAGKIHKQRIATYLHGRIRINAYGKYPSSGPQLIPYDIKGKQIAKHRLSQIASRTSHRLAWMNPVRPLNFEFI
jgi:hypothetical protein